MPLRFWRRDNTTSTPETGVAPVADAVAPADAGSDAPARVARRRDWARLEPMVPTIDVTSPILVSRTAEFVASVTSHHLYAPPVPALDSESVPNGRVGGLALVLPPAPPASDPGETLRTSTAGPQWPDLEGLPSAVVQAAAVAETSTTFEPLPAVLTRAPAVIEAP